ncbi:MAG: aspartate 1-decarboxylase [Anaerolineae bacterium]
MIYRTMLFAKIHRATVTAANVDYVGSITIDKKLLEATGIRPYERVQVVDIQNGHRLETYVIEGPEGSGAIELNGAAARLVHVGDQVIIMAYAQVPEPVPADWSPTIVLVDQGNRIAEILRGAETAGALSMEG